MIHTASIHQATSEQTKYTLTEHDKMLAHRFFPTYTTSISHLINKTEKLHPTSAYRMTMGLLSFALRKKLKPVEKAFYKNGKRTSYIVDRKQFYTYTYGSGTPILMVHGFVSHGAYWMTYVDILVKQGFEVTVIDAPGHGTSPGLILGVPTFRNCVREVLASKHHWHSIITHSMGSLVSAIAASEVSSVTSETRIVTMNTFETCDALMSKFARCLGINETTLSGTKDWIINYAKAPLTYYSLPFHLNIIKAQTLLVYDTDDIIVPEHESHRIIQKVENLTFIKTSGYGHNLRSQEVINQVIDFVLT